MIVSLSIGRWGAEKEDRIIAGEVARQRRSDPKMHKHKKLLVAKETLAAIQSAISQATTYHRFHTLPWLDDGKRVLPSAKYFAYMERMRELERQFKTAVDEFTEVYPTVITQAKKLLGDSFNQNDYPSTAEIKRRFAFRFGMEKLPEATDFRVPGIGPVEEARIRREIEARTQAAVQGIKLDIFKRIHERVSRIAARMEAYDEREERKDKDGKVDRTGTFSDTLVTNLRDLVEIIPELDITGSPEIATLRTRLLAQLCRHEPDDLRKSHLLRRRVRRNAEKIVEDTNSEIARIQDTLGDFYA